MRGSQQTMDQASRAGRARFLMGLILSLAGSVSVRYWIDGVPPLESRRGTVVEMSLSSQIGFGFQAVLADWYWIRTLHYFGSRVGELGEVDVQRMPQLRGLLRQTVTLDPRHLAAWRFGAFFLGQVDPEEGLRFIRDALRENPQEWRLVADQAFINWQAGRHLDAAAAWQRAAGMPGAPGWLRPMAAVVLAEGGEVATARTILRVLIETTKDPFVRDVCLHQIERLEEDVSPAQGAELEPRR
jgi:hypothetical protein